MESRKLISFGSSSYVISLPKCWVDQNKLGKGDSLYIEEKPNELLLTIGGTEKEKEIREKQVDASNKSMRRIGSEIAAAYLGTYDILEIRNIDEKDAEKIKQIIQDFAGLEILEQTSTKIVARDLINVNEVSIKTLIRRIDIILRSMIDDVLDCFKDCSKVSSFQLSQRDMDVNRLAYLTTRMAISALKDPKLAKKFNTDPVEIAAGMDLAKLLENIGDQLKRIARHIEYAKEDEKQFNFLWEIFRVMKEKYTILMKAYYSADVNTAFEIEMFCAELVKKCDDLFNNGINKHTFNIITKLKNFVSFVRYAARTITLSKF